MFPAHPASDGVDPEPAGPSDDVADSLVDPADLVRAWLDRADRALSRAERRDSLRLHRLTSDPSSVDFTMAFADRVLRPESASVAAEQLRLLVARDLPPFLSPLDRALLRVGAACSRPLPRLVMPLARRRLRQIVGALVVDQDDAALRRYLAHRKAEGYRVNANLLGEFVLGDAEAARRLRATIALMGRDDIDYVSVKASSVASQLNLWAYEETLERVKASLRQLFAAAAATSPPKFVNLDMEEYKDLRLTIDAFTQLLDEPAFRSLEAGIVLQAYLPDSFDALRELQAWARRRRERGGAAIKVRIVKGANLAMERVDAVMHGWTQAPYDTKAETDANYKRLLDWSIDRRRLSAVCIGVASHNVFDVAWAKLLADARGVTESVNFEMLQGMAPGVSRAVRDATGGVLLYTPIVAAGDFDHALAYLFRRLEENSGGDNFLRHLFDLATDADAFAVEHARFEAAVADRWQVASRPRRLVGQPRSVHGFDNEPDADPTDPVVRASIVAAVAAPPVVDVPAETTNVAEIDDHITTAAGGGEEWRAMTRDRRRSVLLDVAERLVERRAELIAIMADEAAKTIAEGNPEVSEAVDFARYYAERIAELDERDGAEFEPLGVVAVVPPWNFPLAIPAGGVLAALAAGNAVVLKPAPETPRTAFAVAQACWDAGVPRSTLRYVRCADSVVGEHLLAHDGIDGIILTGSLETAERFRSLAPATPLFAETSGKNAIVVMPDADLDLAVADIVHSAFGHAGQKCSAASLAICVGSVATSERFRRQLLDATRSLIVATPDRPEAVMGPLIGAPSAKLHRALTQLEAGQRWLLRPRLIDPATNLWTPAIVDGVQAGSWFHRTECFGPVLGLMAAHDLDEAISVQNAVPYGLTGGIHTLDPEHVQRWLERVEVGNAYVNRGVTGAIVRRQPFGGWKRSVIGPGAKAGGPNYVAQLGRWRAMRDPELGEELSPRIAAFVATVASELEPAERVSLERAARSDARAWRTEFATVHDPSRLAYEGNEFRYRALPTIVVRVTADARPAAVARVLAAAMLVGAPLRVSAAPGSSGPFGSVARHEEHGEDFVGWARRARPDRVRLLGDEPAVRAGLPATTFVDDRPPIGDGRIELLRYVREQTVSRTRHRFGNLVASAGAADSSRSRPFAGI
jgi:RHH-type proline utilization regulon transcriptional repressor/proline dehydrogenase/delta 1-pyrroline-5-carboxylate dehydrogenase